MLIPKQKYGIRIDTLTEEQGDKLVKSLGQRMLDKQKARSERNPYER